MLKYIVTYFIVKVFWGACPMPEPKVDEFGRTDAGTVQIRTTEVCLVSDTTTMEKMFDTRKEALNFIKKGKLKAKSDWGTLHGFKMDSLDWDEVRIPISIQYH
jgi:hypothetical protein